jgi:shikimate kinase
MGMMGSGKSTVGRQTARTLRLPYRHLDAMVEAHFGLSIPKVFATLGEQAFRQAEEALMLDLAMEGRDGVISLGGGSVLSSRGMQALKAAGKCVYLRGSVSTLLERASRRIESRPLIANAADPGEEMARLLGQREHLYLQYADLIIDVDQNTIDALVKRVCAEFGGHFRVKL